MNQYSDPALNQAKDATHDQIAAANAEFLAAVPRQLRGPAGHRRLRQVHLRRAALLLERLHDLQEVLIAKGRRRRPAGPASLVVLTPHGVTRSGGRSQGRPPLPRRAPGRSDRKARCSPSSRGSPRRYACSSPATRPPTRSRCARWSCPPSRSCSPSSSGSRSAPRSRSPGSPATASLVAVVNTGMGVPPVVIGLTVALFLWRTGPLGGLHLMYTIQAMVVAQVLIALPIVAGLSLRRAAAARRGLPHADHRPRRRAPAPLLPARARDPHPPDGAP